MTTDTPISIFERIFQPADEALIPSVARYFLRMGFSPADQSRVSELLEKVKSDTITPGEREEIESYNYANHLLTILKARARHVLDEAGE